MTLYFSFFCIQRRQIAQVNRIRDHARQKPLVFIMTKMIINVKSLLTEDVRGTRITMKLKMIALKLVLKVIYDLIIFERG